MKLSVLGSGSKGNAIALRTDGGTLLVDAGFGPRSLETRAVQAGVPLDPLIGVLLTHEHGDHARGAVAMALRKGCPIVASPGTLARVQRTDDVAVVPLRMGATTTLGGFTVEAARTTHDASEPVALAISEPSGARVGIAYDLGRPTAGVRYLLRDCAALVLEANHDDVLLRTGPYPASVRQRIAGSGGHLSNRAAAELAARLVSPALEAVILVHLSEQCNHADLARSQVARALAARGFKGRVLVANQREPTPAITTPAVGQLSLSLRAGLRPR